jgi:hypothetical protein
MSTTLNELEEQLDFCPDNPQTITTVYTIECTDKDVLYRIGNPPHAYTVATSADITITDATGAAKTYNTDFFCLQSKKDILYSTDYILPVYSLIKFATVGTYKVTKHISVGKYMTQDSFNIPLAALKTVVNTTIPAIQEIDRNQDTRLTTDEANLQTEISDRATADTAEYNRATTAETTLQSNIDAETTARTDADTTINTRITDLKSINLADMPTTLTGQAGKVITVKADASGYELDTPSAGGSGSNDIRTITLTSANYTLTADDAKYNNFTLSGAPTAGCNVYLPSSTTEKIYTIINECTGSHSDVVVCVTGGGTGIIISAAETLIFTTVFTAIKNLVLHSYLGNPRTAVNSLNSNALNTYTAGNASGNIPISNGTANVNLNADMVDGYHVGNNSGQVPLSNSFVNAGLWATLSKYSSITVGGATYGVQLFYGYVASSTELSIYVGSQPIAMGCSDGSRGGSEGSYYINYSGGYLYIGAWTGEAAIKVYWYAMSI